MTTEIRYATRVAAGLRGHFRGDTLAILDATPESQSGRRVFDGVFNLTRLTHIGIQRSTESGAQFRGAAPILGSGASRDGCESKGTDEHRTEKVGKAHEKLQSPRNESAAIWGYYVWVERFLPPIAK